MEGRAHSGGGPRKGFRFWGLTPSFLCGGARAREGGGDKISEPRSISDCESTTPIGKTAWEKRRARRVNGC